MPGKRGFPDQHLSLFASHGDETPLMHRPLIDPDLTARSHFGRCGFRAGGVERPKELARAALSCVGAMKTAASRTLRTPPAAGVLKSLHAMGDVSKCPWEVFSRRLRVC